MVVGVGVQVWSMLPQIGRRWVQGRLVVAMGHTSECGVVVASVGAPHGPCSVLAARQWGMGGWW